MYYFKKVIIWLVILLVGLIMLYGRYDWSDPVYPHSLRGYLSSAYLFILFLPTFYYTVYHFLPKPRIIRVITFCITLILVLPYQWLGLDSYAYVSHYYGYDKNVQLEWWFPNALQNYQAIPYEGWLFGGLVLVGLSIAAMLWQYKSPLLLRSTNRKVLGLLVIYLAIVAQTWLHLSLRSPLNYTGHYIYPTEENSWYIV
jgi:hypothetical protein